MVRGEVVLSLQPAGSYVILDIVALPLICHSIPRAFTSHYLVFIIIITLA